MVSILACFHQPYDYRLSQMFYEASQGVKPDFPFHKMKNDNGNEVALPNKTAIFRVLWLDVVRAGREDSIIKKSSSIDNFGGANFLPQQVSSHAAVVHGKLRRDNWNDTAHPMSLVVLEASSDSFHHILGDLDSADHPFTEVVVLVRCQDYSKEEFFVPFNFGALPATCSFHRRRFVRDHWLGLERVVCSCFVG